MATAKSGMGMFSCLLTAVVIAFLAVTFYEKVLDKEIDCTVEDVSNAQGVGTINPE